MRSKETLLTFMNNSLVSFLAAELGVSSFSWMTYLCLFLLVFSCLWYLGSGTCLKFCWAKNAFTVTYLAEHVCMNFMFCWIQVSAQLPLLFCGLFIGGAAEEGSSTTNRRWWLTCSWKFTTAAYWQIPLSWPLAVFIIWSWSHGSSTGTT